MANINYKLRHKILCIVQQHGSMKFSLWSGFWSSVLVSDLLTLVHDNERYHGISRDDIILALETNNRAELYVNENGFECIMINLKQQSKKMRRVKWLLTPDDINTLPVIGKYVWNMERYSTDSQKQLCCRDWVFFFCGKIWVMKNDFFNIKYIAPSCIQ